MAFCYTEVPEPSFAAVRDAEKGTWRPRFLAQWFVNDVSQLQLDFVEVGLTRYPFQRTILAQFEPPSPHAVGRFTVADLPRELHGEGPTLELAKQDFELRLHKLFQQLVAMRPFEMTPEESRTWDRLRNIIDIQKYNFETPLVVNAYGTITKVEHGRLRIHWEDGSRTWVSFSQLPGNMAAFVVGSSFNATLKRHSFTGKLMRILAATRLPASQCLSDSAIEDLVVKSNLVPRKTRPWK